MAENEETGRLDPAHAESPKTLGRHSFRARSRRLMTHVLPSWFGDKEDTAAAPSTTRTENPLSERLRFIRKYVDAVSPEHVLSILRTPGYDSLAPYFGLKIFHGQPERQQGMLSTISNTLAAGGGYPEAARVAGEYMTNSVDSGASLSPTSPKELSRVAYWGPTNIERRSQEVVEEALTADETPVLLAYGGLLGLKAALEHTTEGNTVLVVIPPKEEDPTDEIGFKLVRSNGQVEVHPLTPQDLSTNGKLAFIDDATHSGNTFTDVRGLFPNARVQERPLFQT